MSWLKIAFGLIKEAVGTEAGQEVISKVGSAIRKEPSMGPQSSQQEPTVKIEAIEAMIADHRVQVDRNLETIVQMLNTQNTKFLELNRRQRSWNIALAAGLGVTFLIALLAVLRG